MTTRFYIGKKIIEDGSLEEWIADKILPVPNGRICECDNHSEHNDDLEGSCIALATSYSYRIDGSHVCYLYLCESCAMIMVSEDYLGDHEYPVSSDGYALAPKHCS